MALSPSSQPEEIRSLEDWSSRSRSEAEAAFREGHWLVYFYAEKYCAEDCAVVAAFAESTNRTDVRVVEIRAEGHPDWHREIATLPALRTYRDGVLVAESAGEVTHRALQELSRLCIADERL